MGSYQSAVRPTTIARFGSCVGGGIERIVFRKSIYYYIEENAAEFKKKAKVLKKTYYGPQKSYWND